MIVDSFASACLIVLLHRLNPNWHNNLNKTIEIKSTQKKKKEREKKDRTPKAQIMLAEKINTLSFPLIFW